MDKLALPKGKAIQVFWFDSASMFGWHGTEDGHIMRLVSLGYVTKVTDNELIITTSVNTTAEQALSPLAIPWGAIRQIVELPERYDRLET